MVKLFQAHRHDLQFYDEEEISNLFNAKFTQEKTKVMAMKEKVAKSYNTNIWDILFKDFDHCDFDFEF